MEREGQLESAKKREKQLERKREFEREGSKVESEGGMGGGTEGIELEERG